MTNDCFKKLNPEEELQFRAWARENYKPGDIIPSIWHPVVRHECELINIEKINSRKDEKE